MKIILIKTINAEKLIRELEETYSSMEGLERFYERNPDNMKLYNGSGWLEILQGSSG